MITDGYQKVGQFGVSETIPISKIVLESSAADDGD